MFYLGSTHSLDLDEHVKESHTDFLRVVMKAVLDSGQEFFHQWMAKTVVKDDSQTLGKSIAQTTGQYISFLQPIAVWLVLPASIRLIT